MNELTSCIEAVVQLLGKSFDAQADPREFRQQVIARVTRLFEENLDMASIIALLIERQHEKSEAKVLGQMNHDHLDISDFSFIEKKLGLNEPTPKNRQRWKVKFEQKRASHLCPQCGYAGNGREFRDVSRVFGSANVQCPLCSHVEYPQFFTKDWTPDEQATFETRRRAKHEADKATAVKRAELADRQKKLLDKVRADAIIAVKAIDEYQWNLNGEDDWQWDEELMESQIRRIMQLMLRPQIESWGPRVPQDEIVDFFKRNLRPTEDLEAAEKEFTRCATAFFSEMAAVMEGEAL